MCCAKSRTGRASSCLREGRSRAHGLGRTLAAILVRKRSAWIQERKVHAYIRPFSLSVRQYASAPATGLAPRIEGRIHRLGLGSSATRRPRAPAGRRLGTRRLAAALAGIVAVRPELADRSEGEGGAALGAEPHHIADGRIILPMTPDQRLRLPSEVNAETRQSGHVAPLAQGRPSKKARLGQACARKRPFDSDTGHELPPETVNARLSSGYRERLVAATKCVARS